jgi:hypothetical protein
MGYHDGIVEVELIDDHCQIVHQGVQVIAGAGRIRTAVAPSIRHYASESTRSESRDVTAPHIRLERPGAQEYEGATRSPILHEEFRSVSRGYEGLWVGSPSPMIGFGLGQDGRRSYECRSAPSSASNHLTPIWFVHDEQFLRREVPSQSDRVIKQKSKQLLER